MDVGGDAAAVVDDADAAVGQQGDVDGVGVAGEGLVDRVVDDLPDQVVQAALAGGADVHAGTLADRLEPLEDGDRAGVVVRALGRTGELGLGRLRAASAWAALRFVGSGLGTGLCGRGRVVSLGHGAPSSGGATAGRCLLKPLMARDQRGDHDGRGISLDFTCREGQRGHQEGREPSLEAENAPNPCRGSSPGASGPHSGDSAAGWGGAAPALETVVVMTDCRESRPLGTRPVYSRGMRGIVCRGRVGAAALALGLVGTALSGCSVVTSLTSTPTITAVTPRPGLGHPGRAPGG